MTENSYIQNDHLKALAVLVFKRNFGPSTLVNYKS